MADVNISDCVADIRAAIYGREVREAIASGIELCYSDISSGVTIAAEATNAANGAATLALEKAGIANDAAALAVEKAGIAETAAQEARSAANSIDSTILSIIDEDTADLEETLEYVTADDTEETEEEEET